MKSLFPEMEADIRSDRTAAAREKRQRVREWLAKRDLTWLIDHLVDHGPQSESTLSSWVMDQHFDKDEFSRRVGDIHIGLECLCLVRKVWRKPNGIHPGTGYPSYVYGIRKVHQLFETKPDKE